MIFASFDPAVDLSSPIPAIRNGNPPGMDVLRDQRPSRVTQAIGRLDPRDLSPTQRVRAAMAISVGMLVLIGGGIALGRLRDWSTRYVQERAEYQIGFNEIRLEPPPPAWLRADAADLLVEIAEQSRSPNRFSVLNQNLEPLYAWIRLNCPWIEDFRRIRKAYPGRLIVEGVVYRQPVAWVVAIDASGNRMANGHWIDRQGVILPANQVERTALPCIIEVPIDALRDGDKGIVIPPIADPVDPVPGQPYRVRSTDGVLKPSPSIQQAAQLADLLSRVWSQEEPNRLVDRVEIFSNVTEHYELVDLSRWDVPRSLYVKLVHEGDTKTLADDWWAWLFWERPPGWDAIESESAREEVDRRIWDAVCLTLPSLDPSRDDRRIARYGLKIVAEPGARALDDLVIQVEVQEVE